MDDVFEKERFRVFVEVDVTELDDAKAVKRGGEIDNGDGAVNDVDFVAGEFTRIKRQSGGGGAGADQEFSPGEVRGGVKPDISP